MVRYICVYLMVRYTPLTHPTRSAIALTPPDCDRLLKVYNLGAFPGIYRRSN
ncbi:MULTISPECIES: hypothetical protein [Cyanophyceae]|uniref:hypothetical protein n=1 Tax=Cyanophyceae TaxID=3028117 RepID=UPI00232D10C3|nr:MULTISPECIES: hypothetical protein [Cyanophyceae]MDB9356274.1 hypothetical protein [Nodularia spumigena CS-587/03]MDB9306041.1 hypothetical protein [Nodularia spumigena CS-591/12]MDB9322102.1 hypothetical protein [Nodularia spumigena CS-591/07A]MDB9330059.1 hypothetical protein [Nodularia spumigena CS-591/04]MDB9340839.1 hypothetical protein [Nodularia spumigena CS-589/07]